MDIAQSVKYNKNYEPLEIEFMYIDIRYSFAGK